LRQVQGLNKKLNHILDFEHTSNCNLSNKSGSSCQWCSSYGWLFFCQV